MNAAEIADLLAAFPGPGPPPEKPEGPPPSQGDPALDAWKAKESAFEKWDTGRRLHRLAIVLDSLARSLELGLPWLAQDAAEMAALLAHAYLHDARKAQIEREAMAEKFMSASGG